MIATAKIICLLSPASIGIHRYAQTQSQLFCAHTVWAFNHPASLALLLQAHSSIMIGGGPWPVVFYTVIIFVAACSLER